MPYANLHTHTVFSDGRLLPAEVLAQVRRDPELVCFALTDHDSLSGIEPMFRALADTGTGRGPDFVPGIEMTTLDEEVGIVHLLGYFPGMTAGTLDRELARVNDVLGDYCLACCRDRDGRDFEGRVRKAYALDLDRLAELYPSPERVIERIRALRQAERREIALRAGKDGDVVRHPIPYTYQDLVAAWADILPHSSTERARLYCLRSDPAKVTRMTELLLEDGLEDEEAHALGSSLQGSIMPAKASPEVYRTPRQGHALLKAAGAVTSIAHPGVSWPKVSLEAFDDRVTLPLLADGLDAIECFYPYHIAHRRYITEHYLALTGERGLRRSGGTDYHGDDRTTLDSVRVDPAVLGSLLGR